MGATIDVGGRSLKGQMKQAGRAGRPLGRDRRPRGVGREAAILRDMRAGEQEEVPLAAPAPGAADARSTTAGLTVTRPRRTPTATPGAGSCAPTASATRCASRAGSTAAVTTAASCSSTCATAPAWSRWSSTRRRRPRRTRAAHALRSEWVISRARRGRAALRRDRQPRSPDRRDRDPRDRASRSWRRPRRRRSRSTRRRRWTRRCGCATATSTCAASRCCATLELRHRVDRAMRESPRRAGLPRDRDADPDPLDARGRARLHRAEPDAARQLLRAAAVAAALQAAADGRRLRALLPDRALLPRRGPARRPPAGVHPARPRDVVRGRRTT